MLDLNRLRVGRQGDLLLCEEVYRQTQAHAARFSKPLLWLFVVQAGELALDLDNSSKQLFLQALGDGPNVCLTPMELLRRLHLSDTAKTREAFKSEYGALPSEVRCLSQHGDRVA